MTTLQRPANGAISPATATAATRRSRGNANLAQRLDQLATATLDDLRAAWRELYRADPPRRLSHDLLARGVADKLQEAAHGGLLASDRRRLETMAGASGASAAKAPASPRLRPGARLVREWHGSSYSVAVLDTGFEFQNRRYASLSQIAREITGAQWSGPRFFGLVKAAPHEMVPPDRSITPGTDTGQRHRPGSAPGIGAEHRHGA